MWRISGPKGQEKLEPRHGPLEPIRPILRGVKDKKNLNLLSIDSVEDPMPLFPGPALYQQAQKAGLAFDGQASTRIMAKLLRFRN